MTVAINLLWIFVATLVWVYATKHALPLYAVLVLGSNFILWGVSIYLLRLTEKGRAVDVWLLPRMLIHLMRMFSLSTQPVYSRKTFQVRLICPKSFYEGESAAIRLNIFLSEIDFTDPINSASHAKPAAYVIPPAMAEAINNGRASVQLEAPAFDFARETARIPIEKVTTEKTLFWLILPKVSGEQKILFRLYDDARHFGDLQCSVRVNRLDGLTAKQVWILGGIFAAVSGALSAVNIIWNIIHHAK